jgi:hypothetical protein
VRPVLPHSRPSTSAIVGSAGGVVNRPSLRPCRMAWWRRFSALRERVRMPTIPVDRYQVANGRWEESTGKVSTRSVA